ncbi:MAG: alpha/beta hydrolase [Planctomycetota bacterium]|nr:alpha/beta hydrolase [Planctomycetota bacterium]
MKFKSLPVCTLLVMVATAVDAADPIKDLSDWLARKPDERSRLDAEKFGSTALSRKQAAEATELLVRDFQAGIRKNRKQEWSKKVIQLDQLSMKFEFRTFGKKPEGGRSLFISMHGGGGAPARVNDQQWQNQIRLYEPREGVYLAPRAPTNTWNLWHQGHIDEFFERIIEDAIVFEGVNPNRVYLMGYSAGGDGVYQLAPRMADSLAAAAMMAGHPNDASPLGLRNIGFTLHMGGKDGAYNRNGVARKWKTMLAEMQKEDPQGYRHEVVIHEQYGHWMNRDDRVAVPWMAKFTREPNPGKVVWRQSGKTHDRFYWLAVNPENRKGGSEVIATRDGNSLKIEKSEKVNQLVVRLNDEIADLDRAVRIALPDGKTVEKKPVRTIQTIAKCLTERFDPAAVYSAEIVVEIE